MSSILLLLEDGEMHPFVPGAGGGQTGQTGSQAGAQQVVLTKDDNGKRLQYNCQNKRNSMSHLTKLMAKNVLKIFKLMAHNVKRCTKMLLRQHKVSKLMAYNVIQVT